jgi:hypothetical protein
MLKLARTLSAAAKPRKSIHDIPSIPHLAVACTSHGIRWGHRRIARRRRADEHPRAIGDQCKSTKQRGYCPVKNQKPKPPLPENDSMFRSSAVETSRAMRSFHHHVLRKRRGVQRLGFRKMQWFVEYNFTLQKSMNSFTLTNYILHPADNRGERNLELEAILKQNDAAGGAVLRTIDTKIIERQCPRA